MHSVADCFRSGTRASARALIAGGYVHLGCSSRCAGPCDRDVCLACRPTHRRRLTSRVETQLIELKVQEIDTEENVADIFAKKPRKMVSATELALQKGAVRHPFRYDDTECSIWRRPVTQWSRMTCSRCFNVMHRFTCGGACILCRRSFCATCSETHNCRRGGPYLRRGVRRRSDKHEAR